MQSSNDRPGKQDMLSQHAIETNHRLGNSDMLSQHTLHRQAILACTVEFGLYKRGCKSPKQLTSWHSKIAVEPQETCHKKSKQLQHLRRLGKRCEA